MATLNLTESIDLSDVLSRAEDLQMSSEQTLDFLYGALELDPLRRNSYTLQTASGLPA